VLFRFLRKFNKIQDKNKKTAFVFSKLALALQPKSKGVLDFFQAEMIPVEPAPGNSGEGSTVNLPKGSLFHHSFRIFLHFAQTKH
jgi:hypothetical protein